MDLLKAYGGIIEDFHRGGNMPRCHIHFNVASQSIDALVSNQTAASIFTIPGPDAANLTSIAPSEPAYSALGAIGPDILFLVPGFKPPVGNCCL